MRRLCRVVDEALLPDRAMRVQHNRRRGVAEAARELLGLDQLHIGRTWQPRDQLAAIAPVKPAEDVLIRPTRARLPPADDGVAVARSFECVQDA